MHDKCVGEVAAYARRDPIFKTTFTLFFALSSCRITLSCFYGP